MITGEEVHLDLFPLTSILPSDLSSFWRYNGSLTTPRCYESVLWTVFQKPVEISNEQVDENYVPSFLLSVIWTVFQKKKKKKKKKNLKLKETDKLIWDIRWLRSEFLKIGPLFYEPRGNLEHMEYNNDEMAASLATASLYINA